jgi:hypothetical protein
MNTQRGRQGAELVAQTLIERFGADARLRSSLVAYSLHELGETEQAYAWLRIVRAIAEIQREPRRCMHH